MRAEVMWAAQRALRVQCISTAPRCCLSAFLSSWVSLGEMARLWLHACEVSSLGGAGRRR